jgi:putative serine protease PepD
MSDTMTRTPYPIPTIEPQWRDASGAAVPPYVTGPPAATAPSPWPRRFAAGAFALVVVAGGGTTGALIAEHVAAAPATAATATSTTGLVNIATSTGTDSLAAVAAAVSPSIVTVLVDGASESGLGSGVVLTANGLILTNNHVIASGGTVSLRLGDGRTVPAKVVGADTVHDLALVQGTGLTGLTPATFGSDDSVAVGDTVLAFGSPLGLEGTVTAGIVSAVDRHVDTDGESLNGLLQTDAPINAGNSGGALVDTSGRVIGINVAIATSGQDSGSIGVGFAVPADTVTSVVQQLRSNLS